MSLILNDNFEDLVGIIFSFKDSHNKEVFKSAIERLRSDKCRVLLIELKGDCNPLRPSTAYEIAKELELPTAKAISLEDNSVLGLLNSFFVANVWLKNDITDVIISVSKETDISVINKQKMILLSSNIPSSNKSPRSFTINNISWNKQTNHLKYGGRFLHNSDIILSTTPCNRINIIQYTVPKNIVLAYDLIETIENINKHLLIERFLVPMQHFNVTEVK